jgi:predicted Zn-dependent peptidase
MTLDLHRAVTPAGLRLLVAPMKGTGAVTFFLAVRTGSRNETPDVFGVSHFLEHLVFKGSRKRPTTRAISQAIDGVGGEINAFTSKEWTAFYAKAASQHCALIVDVVSDMVLHPLLKAEEIDRERGVIIEEINMYEDTPMRSIGDVFEETLYGRHTLAHTITGPKQIIASVPQAAIGAYLRRQYHARSVVAVLAGNVEPRQGLSLLRKALRACPPGRARPAAPFTRQWGRERVRVKTKKTDQTHVVIGAPGVPFLHPDRPALDLLATILGGGMSSRLFLEVRERRGLAYAVRTSPEHCVDTGYVATQAGVDSTKLREACAVIVDEHVRLREVRVGAAELKKAREFLKGKLLLTLEASDDVAQFVALQELMTNRILSPDDVFRLLDAVTPADIRRVARQYVHPRRLRLVAIGPELDAGSLQKVLTT